MKNKNIILGLLGGVVLGLIFFNKRKVFNSEEDSNSIKLDEDLEDEELIEDVELYNSLDLPTNSQIVQPSTPNLIDTSDVLNPNPQNGLQSSINYVRQPIQANVSQNRLQFLNFNGELEHLNLD